MHCKLIKVQTEMRKKYWQSKIIIKAPPIFFFGRSSKCPPPPPPSLSQNVEIFFLTGNELTLDLLYLLLHHSRNTSTHVLKSYKLFNVDFRKYILLKYILSTMTLVIKWSVFTILYLLKMVSR